MGESVSEHSEQRLEAILINPHHIRLLVDGRLNLLGDTIPKFSGSMESMLIETEMSEIAKATDQTGKTIDKTIINKCIQECVARKLEVSLKPATVERFKTLVNALRAKLDAEATA